MCPALFGAGTNIFDALRDRDAVTVTALLKSATDPNQRNEMNATALMYAAAFSSPECLRLLLDRGAQVNASSADGSTALMWAAGDTTKIRLLLEHGAEVNARTKDGTTALVTAARRENIEASRLLLAHGADAQAPALVRIAFATANPALRRLLKEAGVKLKDPSDLAPIPGLALNKVERMREYLDIGGNPNQGVTLVTGQVNLLSVASVAGELDTVRLLVDRGANVQAKNMHNWTPLMMAATSSRPEIAHLLIEKGADLQARDDAGRTALDWALSQGDTEMASLLRKAGARPGLSAVPAPEPIARPRTAAAAVKQALTALEPIGAIFHQKSGCVSCHNNSLPQAAMAVARSHGVSVNREAIANATTATLDTFRSRFDELMLSSCARAGFLNSVTKGFFGFREEGVAPNLITDAVTSCLMTLQQPNGNWAVESVDLRPPLSSTPIVSTAIAILTVDRYSPPALRGETKTRISRALDFLRTATPIDTQDEAFKLLGFVWAGAAPSEILRQGERLTSMQHDDGGWSQLPKMAADAYATGEALYALCASGLSPKNAIYKKGADYLLRTQLQDGSWYVRTRAFGFQPYDEYGFPHGKDQFISSSATSWAAIALANSL